MCAISEVKYFYTVMVQNSLWLEGLSPSAIKEAVNIHCTWWLQYGTVIFFFFCNRFVFEKLRGRAFQYIELASGFRAFSSSEISLCEIVAIDTNSDQKAAVAVRVPLV